MKRWQIGAGFNPRFLAKENKNRINIPDSVSYIELGFQDLKHVKEIHDERFKNIQFSLHLARAPITEDYSSQDIYIDALSREFDPKDVISIGLHLISPRTENMGKYGLTTHYYPCDLYEKRAVRFIKTLKHKFNLPIWIENANFYSSNGKEIIEAWKSTNRIANLSNSKIIVDLAHIFVDCRNNEIEPSLVYGLIDWSQVIELHFSGYLKGKDGTYHDGHGEPITNALWEEYKKISSHFLGHNESIEYFTVEHSDPIWLNKKNEFYSDFKSLEQILNSTSKYKSLASTRIDSYAQSYLIKILLKRLPALKDYAAQENLNLKQEVNNWVLNNHSGNIVLSDFEAKFAGNIAAEESFIAYLEKREASHV